MLFLVSANPGMEWKTSKNECIKMNQHAAAVLSLSLSGWVKNYSVIHLQKDVWGVPTIHDHPLLPFTYLLL